MLIGDILRQNAHYFPERLALAEGDLRLSWDELDRRVNRLSNGLNKLGLAKGDRLAILSHNCYQYVELYFAFARTGIIGIPLNVRLAVPELVQFLNYTKPKALAVPAGFAEETRRLKERVPSLEHVIGLGPDHPFTVDYEALVRESPADPLQIAISPDDPYVLGSTSGTTGIPKAAILTQRGSISAMMSYLAEIDWPLFGSMIQGNLQYFNPGGPAVLQSILKAGAIIILPEFKPLAWAQLAHQVRPFFAILPGAMFRLVVGLPEVDQFDLSSIGCVITGGSPIPVPLLKRALEIFGKIIHPTFALCESYSVGTCLRPDDLVTEGPPEKLARLNSVGLPYTNIEVRVVNDQGQDIKWGSDEVGEIIMRGEQMCLGYWEMPEESAAAFKDGWFRTGDLAKQDADGYIFLVDRKKDMIKSGGINVYSVEVESVISLHPAVSQVAVIGVPDDRWGEAVKAIIVLKEGMTATEDEIILHCREHLASYKKPQSVEFRESMPVGGTGKVLKRELRDPYWAGREQRI